MPGYDQFSNRKVTLLTGSVAAFIVFGIGCWFSSDYPSPGFHRFDFRLRGWFDCLC